MNYEQGKRFVPLWAFGCDIDTMAIHWIKYANSLYFLQLNMKLQLSQNKNEKKIEYGGTHL